jgi:integrase
VDFKKNTVFIKWQRQHLPKEGEVIKEPKSKAGTRLIGVSPTVMTLLKMLRKNQFENRLKFGTAWVDNDYVFKHDDGTPIYPNRPHRWLTDLLKKHGLPKLTVHGIRHTSATHISDMGVSDKALSSRLGHANLNVIYAVYVHELKSQKNVAANIMEDFYTKKSQNNILNEKGS